MVVMLRMVIFVQEVTGDNVFCYRYINIDDCWLAHERDRYL